MRVLLCVLAFCFSTSLFANPLKVRVWGKRIGSGDYGEVYEAVLEDGRRVAIKFSSESERRRLWTHEAGHAAFPGLAVPVLSSQLRLCPPNLQVDRPALVMALIDGEDVLALANPDRKTPLPAMPKEAVKKFVEGLREVVRENGYFPADVHAENLRWGRIGEGEPQLFILDTARVSIRSFARRSGSDPAQLEESITLLAKPYGFPESEIEAMLVALRQDIVARYRTDAAFGGTERELMAKLFPRGPISFPRPSLPEDKPKRSYRTMGSDDFAALCARMIRTLAISK